MTQKVLLISSTIQHFGELFPVALLLQSNGFSPKFYFDGRFSDFTPAKAKCDDSHIPYISQYESKPSTPKPTKKPSRSWKKWLKFGILLDLKNMVSFFSERRKFKVQYDAEVKNIQQILASENPDLIIFAGLNVQLRTNLWEKLAGDIPCVVVPFALAGLEDPAGAIILQREQKIAGVNLVNYFVAWRYPHWVLEYRGQRLLRLSPQEIFAIENLEASPPIPWLMNSTLHAPIAVESQYMYDFYTNLGIPAEKLILTGALYNDLMANIQENFAENRANLYAELGLETDKPMILCAIPPDKASRLEEFSSFEEMTRFWMQTVNKVGFHVVVSLHPKLDPTQFDYLEDLGAKISSRKVDTLIPLCHIYVASVSSTIRLAVAAGKPVINYDVYKFRYDDFKDIGGVITMETPDEFAKTVDKLTGDDNFYQNTLSEIEMGYFGNLDGKTGERMLAFFQKLVS